MNKIILIPLDERPCNLHFPKILPKANYELVMPEEEILSKRKTPLDVDVLMNWVKDHLKDASHIILSMDTLIYGGLIPSRLHYLDKETLLKRVDFIKEIKKINPKIKIYGFQTIMRCPFYSSNEEEPDYYKDYGKEIHKYGRFLHKQQLGLTTDYVEKEFEELKKHIPAEVLEDFLNRRKINLEVMKYTISLVKEGFFDYFVIPQDDSSVYGFTSMDQEVIRKIIKENNLFLKVPIYPGADEVGMMLLTRAINDVCETVPKIYVYYSSSNGPMVVPSFEDRPIDATMKSQIIVSGSQRVYSLPEADIVVLVNIGSKMLYFPKELERVKPYDIERSLPELLSMIRYAKSLNKIVAVADVAIPTGADFELVNMLRDEDLLFTIDAYASWNTSSNTIGTILAESILYFVGNDIIGNKRFLVHRYYDDVGFCSYARGWTDVNAALANGFCEAQFDGVRGLCTRMCRDELMRFMNQEYPMISKYVEDIDVSTPWNRSFEMKFVITYKGELHDSE